MSQYAYVILYVCFASISLNVLNYITASVPESLTLVVGVITAIAFFHMVNLAKLRHIYSSIYHNLGGFILLNCLVLLLFGAPFFGASRHADIMIISFNCTISIFSMTYSKIHKNSVSEKVSLFILYLILVGVFINSMQKYSDYISSTSGVVGGVSAFYYMKLSKGINDKLMLSASQILAVRWFLILIFAAIMLVSERVNYSLTYKQVGMILFIAFCTFIIPNYLLQKSIEKIGHIKSGLLSNSIPVVTSVVAFIMFGKLHAFILCCALVYLVLNLKTVYLLHRQG